MNKLTYLLIFVLLISACTQKPVISNAVTQKPITNIASDTNNVELPVCYTILSNGTIARINDGSFVRITNCTQDGITHGKKSDPIAVYVDYPVAHEAGSALVTRDQNGIEHCECYQHLYQGAGHYTNSTDCKFIINLLGENNPDIKACLKR